MAEKTLHQKQSQNRPELLDSIEEFLEGGVKQTALNFVEYCKANKMPIRWGSTYRWYVYFKSKHIADIGLRFVGMVNGAIGTRVKIKENSCIIQISYLNADSHQFEDYISKENLSEVIWKNVKHCEGCLTTCAPGKDKIILGRSFKNVCGGSIRFFNPAPESLNCIKKLLELRKNDETVGIFYR